MLLDLELPLLSGQTIQRAMKADPRTADVPIIVITGTDLTTPFPVVRTLTKPVSPEDLVVAVFDALEQSPTDEERRVIVWHCPVCKRVMRRTREIGHAMTSEMRTSEKACRRCLAGIGRAHV